MRAVYNIYGAITNEQPLFGAFYYLVPEISRVEIQFLRPSYTSLLDGNIVEKMTIGFDNGSELEINGVYLHKFFNTPPEAVVEIVGEEEKYIKHNPYTSQHTTEELIGLIRKAFLHLIVKMPADFSIERLKRILITYDGDSFFVKKELYPELDKATENKVMDLLSKHIELEQKKYNTLLTDFVQEALLKQKVEQSFVREGGGLRNSFKEIEWGDVSRLSFLDIMHSYDPYRAEGIPYYTTYSDRLKEYGKKHSIELLDEVITHARAEDPESLFNIYAYFYQLDGEIKTDRLAERLINESDSAISSALSDYWWNANSKKSITDVLQYEGADE